MDLLAVIDEFREGVTRLGYAIDTLRVDNIGAADKPTDIIVQLRRVGTPKPGLPSELVIAPHVVHEHAPDGQPASEGVDDRPYDGRYAPAPASAPYHGPMDASRDDEPPAGGGLPGDYDDEADNIEAYNRYLVQHGQRLSCGGEGMSNRLSASGGRVSGSVRASDGRGAATAPLQRRSMLRPDDVGMIPGHDSASYDSAPSFPRAPSGPPGEDIVEGKDSIPCLSCNHRFWTKAHLQLHEATVHAIKRTYDDMADASNDHDGAPGMYDQARSGSPNDGMPGGASISRHNDNAVTSRAPGAGAQSDGHSGDAKRTRYEDMGVPVDNGAGENVLVFPCRLCRSSFERPGDLRKHMGKVHSRRERPYICPQCENRYMTPNQLRDHVSAVHDKKRPYECEECGARFGLNHNLLRHLRSVHAKKTPENMFRLPRAGLTPAQKAALNMKKTPVAKPVEAKAGGASGGASSPQGAAALSGRAE